MSAQAQAQNAAKAVEKAAETTPQAQSFLQNFWEANQMEIINAGKQVLIAIAVIVIAIICIKVLTAAIHKIAAKTGIVDEAAERLIRLACRYSVGFFALLIILDLFGVNTNSLLTILGTAGLAIGLALKDTLSNMAAGLILLITRPYNLGDYIQCGAVSGTVKKMGLFTSELTTADGLFVSVPNNALWGAAVTNYNRNDLRRIDIVAGVAYTDNIDKGIEVLMELMNSNPLIVKDPAPEVLVAELADSSVNLQLRFWCSSADYWTAYWGIKAQLKKTIEGAGLNIPFPQRVVTMVQAAPAQIEK